MNELFGLNLRQKNFLEKTAQECYDKSATETEKKLQSKFFKEESATVLSKILKRFVEDKSALKGISIGKWENYLSPSAAINALWDRLGIAGKNVPGKILEHFDLVGRKDEIEAVLTEASHRGAKGKIEAFARKMFMQLATDELTKSKGTKLITRVQAPLVSAFTIAETKAMWEVTESNRHLSNDQFKDLTELSNVVSSDAKQIVQNLPKVTLEREVIERANKHPSFVVKEPEFMASIKKGGEALDELILGSSQEGMNSDFRNDLYESYFADKFNPSKYLHGYVDESVPQQNLETFLEVAHYTSMESALNDRVSGILKMLASEG